jgi:hypothetical protein
LTSIRNRTKALLSAALLVGAPAAILLVGADSAGALTTITVTSNADSGSNTLRAAVTTANSTADDVEIDIAADLGTITLASALPVYTGDGANHSLTVKGNGVTIAGASGANVFGTTVGYAGAETFDSLTINGGAIAVSTSGHSPITLTNSTLSGGSEDGIDTGGGPVLVSNSSITGRGSDAIDTGGAPVTVTDSTLAGNAHDGVDTGGSSVTIENSTIANNMHDGIDAGGTIIQLAYVTMTGNGDLTGDGQVNTGGGSLTSFGSVITSPPSGNSNCNVGATTLTSQGYNYSDDATCGFTQSTDKQSAPSPNLGALADNGGLGQTELPQAGSPLIDAIPVSACQTGLAAGITTDERGVTRPQGSGCDIGAVEVSGSSFNPNGYRMVADEGGIFDFGLNFNGSLANVHLNSPIVGIANSPGPNGYLMASGDGGVFALGGANFYGSLCCRSLPSPISAIAATPREDGYWLASQTGAITNFGNTPLLPAAPVPSGGHIVGMASTNDGKGAWLTDQMGDVYAEGDAQYLGGITMHLNAPIVGIAAAATGQGYILVASDGGTFNYGVPFHGSVPASLKAGQSLVAPIVGIAVTHSGNGYWMVGADGGLFNYGDAPFLGSIYTTVPGGKLNGPIVGIQHLGLPPS